jgi:hypothetical protein
VSSIKDRILKELLFFGGTKRNMLARIPDPETENMRNTRDHRSFTKTPPSCSCSAHFLSIVLHEAIVQ